MGLYSGGLIIGRIFVSEIFWGVSGGGGGLFSGGLSFGGAYSVIGILR